MEIGRGSCVALSLSLGLSAWAELTPFKPTTEDLRASYLRADSARRGLERSVWQLNLTPNWVGDNWFWYLDEISPEEREFVLVESATGVKTPLFDHSQLSRQLGELLSKTVESKALRLANGELTADLEHFYFRFEGQQFDWNRKTSQLSRIGERAGTPAQQGRRQTVAGLYDVRVREGVVETKLKSGTAWKQISKLDGFVRTSLCPDGTSAVGIRVIPGDRKEVFTIKSTENPLRGVLQTRKYDQPGDKLDTAEYFVYELSTGKESKVEAGQVICGGYPWSSPPNVDWWKPDGETKWSFVLDFVVRGFQAYKVLRVSVPDGAVTTVVDEKEGTFFDTTKMQYHRLDKSGDVLWRSERDRWGHLYLINGKNGQVKKQLTSGPWVTRDVGFIDEDSRQVYFAGNGREAGDPYFLHAYRVGLDGNGLVRLTEGNGTHSQVWSPGHKFFIDSWSRVDQPTVYELRNRDGKLIQKLDEVGIVASGGGGFFKHRPEPFVAKGRDGKTDIYGLIFRPSQFDPSKTYPVVENIYAGPHDSFVPKSYSPVYSSQQMAEIGFIVVQIDGMGTNNRGKDFHDFCWRNIKDAGFPDRILWMKTAAAKYPQMDVSRVGIYGTSAGGQNAAGALLFHPEFYKSAVASCGCHDNRIDKYWWNEQWMGYPVGPWYAESSNIDNAGRLRGNLLLMVGEVDSNVPPESTYKLEEALMKAGKDFEFVHLPGLDHTAGGVYGERKRRDFFVKTLLGVEPPFWNQSTQIEGGR